MPSTFSTNLGIELITTGEQAGTWGATTNTNLGTLIEQAISGYVTQVITDGADTVITIPSGSTGVARNMTLELTGALSAARNLIVPSNRKLYFIYNNTTGGYAVTVKVSGQTGVSVPNGAKVLLVSNGTDVVNAVNYIPALYFSAGTAAAPSISTIGDTNTGIYFPAADKVAIATGGTQRVIVDDSGNVGVGTGSPAQRLDVSGTQNSVQARFGNVAGRGLEISTALIAGTNDAGSVLNAKGATSGTLIFQTDSTERMRLDSTGNLGIGTSSPSYLLTTNYNANATFSNAVSDFTQMWQNSGVNGLGVALADDLTARLVTNNGYQLAFNNGAVEAMRLDSSGNLGVGTSSPSSFAGYTTVSVNNATNGGIYNILVNGTETARLQAYSGIFNVAARGASTNLTFETNDAERARIDSSGNLGIGTTNTTGGGKVRIVGGTQPLVFDSTGTTSQLVGPEWRASDNSLRAFIKDTTETPSGGEFRIATNLNDSFIAFATNNNLERMRLDSSGNLGLGVTPSAWSGAALELQTGAALYGFADTTNVVQNAYYNAGWKYKATAAAAIAQVARGAHYWFTAPSGTAGNTITFTQAMTLDASGKLGINTTSPNAMLEVSGVNSGSTYESGEQVLVLRNTSTGSGVRGAGIRMCFGTSNSGSAQIDLINGSTGQEGSLSFGTRNSSGSLAERMRLDSSGNLGLGVTPPAWGTAAPYRALQLGAYGSVYNSNGGLVGVGGNHYNNGTNFIYLTTNRAVDYRQNIADGSHAWFTAPSGTAGNAITFTQAMTLDASGNLGIGTSTPTYKLTISGAAGDPQILSTDGNVLSFIAYPSGAGTSAVNFIGTYSAHAQVFITNNVERARITSGGDFFVGTTTQTFTTTKVEVVAAATQNGLGAKVSSSGYTPLMAWNSATTGDNSFMYFYTEATATARGNITYNRAGGLVAYNTTSDYRAKDILGPVVSSGATIDALKVYEGLMKGATQPRPMLIAHETQEYAPYAVTGVKDAVNEDGTPRYQQMDVSSLVPLLIAEIQSLRARVAALESN